MFWFKGSRGKLTDALDRLSKGDYSLRLEPGLAVPRPLAEAFNAAAEKVETKIKEMEEEIKRLKEKGQEASRLLEEELIRTNSDLVRKEVMLEQINEELLAASQVKSEFITNMGRELKTPLNSITGLADFVVSGKLGVLNQRQGEYLTQISQSAKNLLDVVDNILEYTLLEIGDRLQYEEFSVREAAGEVAESFLPMAESNLVALFCEVPDIRVWADLKKFRFILHDLLHNAIKFNKPGGRVTLRAYVREIDEGQPYIEFHVEDTGWGFPPSLAGRLFRPFSQLVDVTGRKPAGTGLSLALVKRYVEMHGGKVWAESRPGSGSLFCFTMPLTMGREEGRKKKKVLVVDDDPDQLELMQVYFAPEPYEILKAFDGMEALEMVEQESPDLVILDVLLPRMDGIEVCNALKRQEKFQRFRHIPVVIITALSDSASRLKGIKAGADDFIVKPLDRRLLVERVKSLIETKEEYEKVLASYRDAEKDSVMDPLTGLYNRRYMDEALAREIKDSERYGRNISLLMIDIDFFKNFNDRHGHQEGDRLLRRLAGIFRETVREVDIVTRYGGEEFLIILPETPSDMALHAAERIRQAVESQAEGTVSIGISTYPADSREKEGLIEKADKALYKAKGSGRNRSERCSPDDGFPVYSEKSL